MPRKARVIIPQVPHHVTQRGNNRQNIFVESDDFKVYCYLINEYAKKYQVSILAYCIMNNHVHFIVVPEQKDGVSKLFNAVHMRYAQYYNYKKKMSGHLWQGRFFSCPLGETHLFCAMRYIEQNPVRAKMVRIPWEYAWSSARWHVGMRSERYIQVKIREDIDKRRWKEYLLNKDFEFNKYIRESTCAGLACAGNTFIDYWERKLNCVLRKKKLGRPFKE